jgi:hypothetical protein
VGRLRWEVQQGEFYAYDLRVEPGYPFGCLTLCRAALEAARDQGFDSVLFEVRVPGTASIDVTGELDRSLLRWLGKCKAEAVYMRKEI